MKFNLKNRPNISRMYYKKCLDCENLQKRFEWFEGFEKELRERVAEYDLNRSRHLGEEYNETKILLLKEILGE